MANKTINDKLSFSNRFILYVRTGENDAKTLWILIKPLLYCRALFWIQR